MDLVFLVLVIALIGFLVYAITKYIPMPPVFQTAIQLLVVIVILLYLIRRFAGTVPNVLP